MKDLNYELRGCFKSSYRALQCMSRSPIVHCHFMLHFYERINVDDYDDDDYDNFAIIAFYLGNGIRAMPVVTMEH